MRGYYYFMLIDILGFMVLVKMVIIISIVLLIFLLIFILISLKG